MVHYGDVKFHVTMNVLCEINYDKKLLFSSHSEGVSYVEREL
jgi:hypothetical protein